MKKEIFIMNRSRTLLLCLILATLNIAALAQEKKVEISGSLGYTVASGFDIDPVSFTPIVNPLAGATVVDRIGVNSGFTFGFQGDYLATENFSLGFLFSRQSSKLTASGSRALVAPIGSVVETGTVNVIEDMPIYNYQFVGTYNFSQEFAHFRPYVFGGLGWTQYDPGTVSVVGPGGSIFANPDSKSKFALTLGGGGKFFVTPSFGFKIQARWTPTYIGSEPDGIWCTSFYCTVDENRKWSNQGEFTGGVIFRF